MTWNWAALVAALLAGGIALYIRLRWRHAPQAYTAMIAVAVCSVAAGLVLGGWIGHFFAPSVSAPAEHERASTVAPELPSAAPSAAVSPEAAAPSASPSGYYCGAERWPVKTLSDEDRNLVNLRPVPSTVAELDVLPRPALLLNNRRAAPVELTTYVVRGVLLEIRGEEDHDYHVVIADPSDRSKTMITEVVDPGCSGAVDSSDLTDLRRARESLAQLDTAQPGKLPLLKLGDLVEITGVGFFDFEHGQSGVAPNAIELHPVLNVRRVN
jgi:hypothetical protein